MSIGSRSAKTGHESNERDASVTVVVSTHNRAPLLHRLVKALEAQEDVESFDVVLVNDSSTDDTAEVLDSLSRTASVPLRPLRTASNRGPAAGRNLGWRSSDSAIVAFTDDDCVPDRRWLRNGLDMLETKPRVGIVQGRTEPAHGYPLAYGVATRIVGGLTPFFEGCNLFVRRPALETTGGFDEAIGFSFEDSALGWAVKEAGFEAAFCESALVEHDVRYPPFRWHLRRTWLECHKVDVVARHPSYRAGLFWRYFSRPEDPAIVLAIAGVLMSRRRRSALVALLPYAWLRRPHPSSAGIDIAAKESLHDLVRVTGLAVRSLRKQTLVL